MTTLEQTLPELERELADARRTVQVAQKRADALQKIVEGVRELNGHAGEIALQLPVFTLGPASPDAPNAPRGREAVRRAVAERPGIWTLSEVVESLRVRGWLTNRKATEVAVHRMVNTGEARRIGHGTYEFPAVPATEAAESC